MDSGNDGYETDSGPELDGDDSFFVTMAAGDDDGPATAGSPSPSPPPPDDLAAADEPASTTTAPSLPGKGKRLLWVMFDMENSNPIKCIGEVFQVAARPFRVETVGSQSARYKDCTMTDIVAPLFSEWIQPRLEFGKNEFHFKVIEVSTASLLAVPSGPGDVVRSVSIARLPNHWLVLIHDNCRHCRTYTADTTRSCMVYPAPRRPPQTGPDLRSAH